MVSSTSDRPEPTSPAMPTISPAWTVSETSLNSPAPGSAPSTCEQRLAASSARAVRGGKTYSMVRPVIRLTSSRVGVVFASRLAAVVRPSLSTVTRSPISRISSRRWEM